ncbi:MULTISPECIES: phage tail protein [Nocardia]|uniref:phage tail protein n=1 Tax=Nocardia abscessus TaxID=120957 RepID=UPI001892EB8E|nr:phage tail protein [Nocardia abscessus]MBF6471350.1 phage tail protein [Nocardia abscessus]
MSRGTVTGLPSAHPISEFLPGIYLDDPLVQRWTAGMDELLAPVFLTLDGLDAYVDATLAPADFLHWLAGWVDAELDERWSLPRRRAVVAAAVALHARRGAIAALRDHIRRTCGCEVEVVDSGGARWSRIPDSAAPGSPTPRLVVRVPADRWDEVNRSRIARAVESMCPAHVPFELVPQQT